MWLFLPIFFSIDTIYDSTLSAVSITYLPPAIVNTWFALSASATVSYCISILLGRRIHPHDIAYSAISVNIFCLYRER
jgi:hypothetical protein